MIYLTVLAVLIALGALYREHAHAEHLAAREKTWDLERGALLTHIQHPEVLVQRATETAGAIEIPDGEPKDEIDLIGSVVDGG